MLDRGIGANYPLQEGCPIEYEPRWLQNIEIIIYIIIISYIGIVIVISRSGRSGLFKVRLASNRSKVGCKYYDGSDDDRYDDDSDDGDDDGDSDDDDDGYDDGDVDDVPTIPILFAAVVSDRVRGSQVLRGRVIYYRHV